MSRVDNNRRRDLLHENKLDDFTTWASSQGYTIEPHINLAYEVLRLRGRPQDGRKPPIIFYKRLKTNHITTTRSGTKLVERWFVIRRDREKGE